MQNEPPPDDLQSFELNEYVQAFKSSSDRVRHLIFILTFLSLLIFVATWNLSPLSWSRTRVDLGEGADIEKYRAEFAATRPPPKGALAAGKMPELTVEQWTEQRAQYVRAKLRESRAAEFRKVFVDRMVTVPVPGLGIVVDVNDIGVLGGIALAVLSLILCFAMVREHENLCLALFKIKRLCQRNPLSHHESESVANVLYHALAMGQVLNYPPTLARWRYGPRDRLAGFARSVMYLIPFCVLGFVVTSNALSYRRMLAVWYPTTTALNLGVQFASLLSVGVLSLISALYSYAGDRRWRGAFELINPGLHHVEQRPWTEWIKLPGWLHPWTKPARPASEEEMKLMTELTYSLRPDQPEVLVGACEVSEEMAIAETSKTQYAVSQTKLRAMAAVLRKKAEILVDEQSKTRGWTVVEWVGYRSVSNRLRDNVWRVTMRCYFRYRRS